MDSMPLHLWIAACAHQLQRRWRTVDSEQLEELARDLARNPDLRAMASDEAAAMWLRPVASLASDHDHSRRHGLVD